MVKRILFFYITLLGIFKTEAQCWKEVSAGGNYSAGIKTDGTLWVWGSLSYTVGSFVINSSVPVQLGTGTNWRTLSAGPGHLMAIQANGTLWGIGDNSRGQLGNNTTTSSNIFLQVGTATTWVSVSSGDEHTIALMSNGTLWGWGGNSLGQLGDGTTVGRLIPIQIGTDTDWQRVSTMLFATMAIKTNGTLWVWGTSNPGIGAILGLGPGMSSIILPTRIGTDTDWKEVSVGYTHHLALKTNGTLWAWGRNSQGELGDGTNIDKLVPNQIGTATDWLAISSGMINSLGLKTSGTLWAWGDNAVGQLGNGTNINSSIPVQVGTSANWQKESVRAWHNLAIRTDGSLWSWGINNFGQVGDGTFIHKNTPVEILSLQVIPTASSVSVCAGYSVTLTASGATTYTWTGGVNNGVPFIPTSSGVYTVTGSDINGCYNTATVAVTVNPNSTVTAQASSTNICSGSTVILSGSGASTYAWSNGVIDGVPFTHMATTTYTVTDASGCSNTASITVSVVPLPTVSVNNATICAGTNALLTASMNPVLGTTYSWSQSSIGNPVTVSPAVNTSYTVTATNNGCSSSAVASVSVVPVNIPVTGFSYPTPLCLVASNPLPTGIPGFSSGGVYSSGTGVATDPATGLIDLSNSSAGTYVVTYSVAANGCNPAASSTASISLDAPTVPVTGFSYLPVCSNDVSPLPLLNTGFTAGGNFSGSGLSVNAGSGVVDLSNTTPGTYTVSYTVGAVNCVMAGTGTTTIAINPVPVLSVSSSTLIYAGDQATLTATSSANSYTWFPSAGLSCSDCTAPVASPNESTTYCVRTTDGVCTNSACITVIVESLCEGDKGFFLPNAFSPNGDGNNDVFCVQGRNRCVTNFQMIIYDRWGEKVFEGTDLSSCWDGTYKGKVLSPDVFVYYIKAQDQNQKELIKKGNVSLIK